METERSVFKHGNSKRDHNVGQSARIRMALISCESVVDSTPSRIFDPRDATLGSVLVKSRMPSWGAGSEASGQCQPACVENLRCNG